MEQDLINRRLDSQDKKLDILLEKFDVIIRLEERHNALSRRVDLQADKVHKHANIIMELQHKAYLNSKSATNIERFFWVVVTAGVGLVALTARGLMI